MTLIRKMVMSSYLPLLNNLTVISVSFFHHIQDHRQKMGSVGHLSQSSRVHSDADKAYPSQKVRVFLLCAVVDALIFFHSPLSNPQHHLQPLPPVLDYCKSGIGRIPQISNECIL